LTIYLISLKNLDVSTKDPFQHYVCLHKI
jgi:hypothetical protein